MPKITLEEFFNQDAFKIIECTTREESDAVREAFDDMGKRWDSGSSFLELDYWEEGDTYIHYSNDCCKGKHKPSDPSWEVYSFDDIIEFSSNYEPDPNQLRVLLRSDYKWRDAHWDGQTKFLSINRNRITTSEIIAIENDPRTKYVQCTKCGSIIKNTKKAINEHAKWGSNSKVCLVCKNLRHSNETELKETLIKNDDGTYTRTKKTVCSLVCGNSWGQPDIESVSARSACMYRRCSANTLGPIEDFFIKYPGAFDDMATVDNLDMSKWEVYCKHYNDWIEFNWKGRSNISVFITNLGIIDKITCHYRNKSYQIVYSKKYDKMFALTYGEYRVLTETNSDFSVQYYNELLRIIRNIYKGEN